VLISVVPGLAVVPLLLVACARLAGAGRKGAYLTGVHVLEPEPSHRRWPRACAAAARRRGTRRRHMLKEIDYHCLCSCVFAPYRLTTPCTNFSLAWQSNHCNAVPQNTHHMVQRRWARASARTISIELMVSSDNVDRVLPSSNFVHTQP